MSEAIEDNVDEYDNDLPVGPGWDEPTLDHPPVLYHHSSRENRASIMQHGLDSRFSETAATDDDEESTAGAIFFSSVAKPEHGYDVWAVDVAGLPLQRDHTTNHHHLGEEWWMTPWDITDIPPSRLRLHRRPSV